MAPSDLVLRALSRLLPREFRERVFEPALADLQFDERSSARARWLGRAVLAAECLRLGVPQLFWRRRRPTRLGAALLGAIVVMVLLIQRINYGAWGRH